VAWRRFQFKSSELIVLLIAGRAWGLPNRLPRRWPGANGRPRPGPNLARRGPIHCSGSFAWQPPCRAGWIACHGLTVLGSYPGAHLNSNVFWPRNARTANGPACRCLDHSRGPRLSLKRTARLDRHRHSTPSPPSGRYLRATRAPLAPADQSRSPRRRLLRCNLHQSGGDWSDSSARLPK